MNELGFLRDFVIIFSAAIAINFLFYRLRIAPVVGYLIAGVLLGPSMLGIIYDVRLIEVLAEVGIILLLFLIGIEFSIEELVRIMQTEKIKDPARNERKKKLNEDFRQLSEHLDRIFSAKVTFKINESGKGKIVIPFENPEDMERILGVFDRLNN